MTWKQILLEGDAAVLSDTAPPDVDFSAASAGVATSGRTTSMMFPRLWLVTWLRWMVEPHRLARPTSLSGPTTGIRLVHWQLTWTATRISSWDR
ncbi:hypothetical protein ACFLYF_05660 [Chloroflexota bacterium]